MSRMGAIDTGPVDTDAGDGVPAGASVATMENGNSGDGVKSLSRVYVADMLSLGKNAWEAWSTPACAASSMLRAATASYDARTARSAEAVAARSMLDAAQAGVDQ